MNLADEVTDGAVFTSAVPSGGASRGYKKNRGPVPSVFEDSMDNLQVWKPGCKVTVKSEPAEVIVVNICRYGVRYEVGFWREGEWKEMWVPESQVAGLACDVQGIGFRFLEG